MVETICLRKSTEAKFKSYNSNKRELFSPEEVILSVCAMFTHTVIDFLNRGSIPKQLYFFVDPPSILLVIILFSDLWL